MRRSDTLIKTISVILLITIICYMGFHLADSLLNPLQTTLAVNNRITVSASVEGYIVRQEQVLTSSGIISPVENGKKVAAGGVVAVSYLQEDALATADRILEIDTRISHLKNIISGTADSSVSDTLTAISSAVNNRNMSDIDAIIYDAEYTFFGEGDEDNDPAAELDDLIKERDTLSSRTSGYSYITAKNSGIFASSTDGFENITYDTVTELTPSELKELFSTPRKSENTFGKLITGNTWYFITAMDSSAVENLVIGGTANIEFTKNYTNSLTMKVDSISNSVDGMCTVIFSCDTALVDICNVRELSGTVIFSSQSGILTPNDALYTDEDGTLYVYLLMGLQSQRVDVIKICDYNDYYCLIAPAEGEILNEGAEIIIRGRNLYDGKVVK